MDVRSVPPEAHGEIDCIALKYRKIGIEPHSAVIAKALNKVVEDRLIVVENVDISRCWLEIVPLEFVMFEQVGLAVNAITDYTILLAILYCLPSLNAVKLCP